MIYTNQELEIIKAIRAIGKECASFTDEECLEVWEEFEGVGFGGEF